jgi:hypothetical protein
VIGPARHFGLEHLVTRGPKGLGGFCIGASRGRYALSVAYLCATCLVLLEAGQLTDEFGRDLAWTAPLEPTMKAALHENQRVGLWAEVMVEGTSVCRAHAHLAMDEPYRERPPWWARP